MLFPLSPKQYLYLSSILFAIGMLFYGIYNEIIILRMPFKQVGTPFLQDQSQRKTMRLIYWNGEQLAKEDKELLYSTNMVRTLDDLITSWLHIQEQEQLLPKKVSVQSIMVDATGHEAFISFDRNPLNKKKSVHEKVMWVQGLLDTLKENGIPLQSIRILVHGKPLHDSHLDFTHSWPLTGYSGL